MAEFSTPSAGRCSREAPSPETCLRLLVVDRNVDRLQRRRGRDQPGYGADQTHDSGPHPAILHSTVPTTTEQRSHFAPHRSKPTYQYLASSEPRLAFTDTLQTGFGAEKRGRLDRRPSVVLKQESNGLSGGCPELGWGVPSSQRTGSLPRLPVLFFRQRITKLVDLIAQSGCLFELQVGGRGTHLFFKLVDQGR